MLQVILCLRRPMYGRKAGHRRCEARPVRPAAPVSCTPLPANAQPHARRGAFMQVRQALQERFAGVEVLPSTYPVPALKARPSALHPACRRSDAERIILLCSCLALSRQLHCFGGEWDSALQLSHADLPFAAVWHAGSGKVAMCMQGFAVTLESNVTTLNACSPV